ncbi:MAG: hypothetical protein CVU05_14955 [Bacteroidetes bacterium HGW-Bacteroidetes-21]|nr:MAG: hypothetical protein CVU05_14955 [Bacteroidetes bacterium HGW-Bacteroidetes-21]
MLSCVSSKKYYNRGQYDAAIYKAVKKIKTNPENIKEVIILEKAYQQANLIDNDRISFLRKEGRPDSWDELLRHYSNLKSRQEVIRPVLPLKKKGVEVPITLINYDNEIIEAKKRAAEFYYVHAKKLLETNDRFKARDAYSELSKVKNYFPVYQDSDELMKQAYEKGQSRVYVTMENNTIYKLSVNYYEEMLAIPMGSLNSTWIKYYTTKLAEGFHYEAKLNLKIIDISPEKLLQKESIHEKDVQDGTEVLLDANNNTVKDSLGNPIRVPRMVKVSCKYIEVTQQKAAHTEGVVEYKDLGSSQVLKMIPIASDYFFENITATAIGDLRALPDDKKKLIGRPPVPFPNDMEMIAGSSSILKKVFHDILIDNKYHFK